MPTYSYACTECDNRFDIFQSFTDDSLSVCPECSGKLRKLFNTVGIVFKGSGFYRNDSRGTSTTSESASSDSSSSSDSKSSDSKSSDSKPSEKKTESSKPAGKSSGSGDKKSASTSAAAGAS